MQKSLFFKLTWAEGQIMLLFNELDRLNKIG